MVGEDHEEDKEIALKRYREIISTLPKERGWRDSEKLYQYEGFWMPFEAALGGIMWTQQHFKPRREDDLLVTLPKSGTTWFKPLMFYIMNLYDVCKCSYIIYNVCIQYIYGSKRSLTLIRNKSNDGCQRPIVTSLGARSLVLAM